MGFDLAMGGIILVSAFRGYFRGFMIQAVRIAGLVSSLYAADPVRDVARPYAQAQWPALRPELLDRILWWAAAVGSYVVIVGAAKLAFRIQRRGPFGETQPQRLDQVGGMLLGALKGAVCVIFLASALQKHAIQNVKEIPWADEQARSSKLLAWNLEYDPAPRIWNSPPIQALVSQVRLRGLASPASAPPAEAAPPRTAQLDPPAGGSVEALAREGLDKLKQDEAALLKQLESLREQLKSLNGDDSR